MWLQKHAYARKKNATNCLEFLISLYLYHFLYIANNANVTINYNNYYNLNLLNTNYKNNFILEFNIKIFANIIDIRENL